MKVSRESLLPLAGLFYLIGALEGIEVLRQRRRGTKRSLVTSSADRDPASCRLLALTWWPAGLVGLAVAVRLPRLAVGPSWRRRCLVSGIIVTGLSIGLRQWAIATLGRYFVGHVLIQPGQTVVTSGPYRWLRHPSYTGFWLEMVGIGLGTGNLLSGTICALLPLIGIAVRIAGEERELTSNLPGYREYARGKARLIPFVW